MKYKYIGETAITIQGIGTIKPKEVVIVATVINHPLFVKIDKVRKNKSK